MVTVLFWRTFSVSVIGIVYFRSIMFLRRWAIYTIHLWRNRDRCDSAAAGTGKRPALTCRPVIRPGHRVLLGSRRGFGSLCRIESKSVAAAFAGGGAAPAAASAREPVRRLSYGGCSGMDAAVRAPRLSIYGPKQL